ncbi:hypothetical protein [Streptomyces griseus]|uniref:hypothetical protein n=1 Tax=Streptomyces griseus TaxID=1911 RepID=UPI000566EACB|nr:hypothetical protein [Streptomyces griseus]
MSRSKETAAVVAGALGGFVLIAAGVAQTPTDGGPGECVNDGRGRIHCVQEGAYELSIGHAVLPGEKS